MADEVGEAPQGPEAHVVREGNGSTRPPVGMTAQITWRCPNCGLDATVPVWVLLDVAQRPDLWPAARGAVGCPECAAGVPRQPAVLVVGAAGGIPLLVAREEASVEPEVVRVCLLERPVPDGFEGLGPHSAMLYLARADAELIMRSSPLPPSVARALEETRAIQRVEEALEAALSALTAQELQSAVEAYPELLGTAVVTEWRQHAIGEDPLRGPAQTTMDRIPETLLDDLTQMPSAVAWQRYVDRVQVAQNAFGDELDREVEDLVAASDCGQASRAKADRCAQLAKWVVPEVHPERAGFMWAIRACMLISPQMAAPDDIEDAIDALERAIELYEAAGALQAAARARSNLMIALHMRPRERELSLERCIVLLQDVVAFWDALPDPDEAALSRTNLAVALLDRKAGDHLDNAHQALEACVVALQHRSPERNPVDYVYTLVNKALAHSRLAASDEAHLLAAEQAYEEALSLLPLNEDPALLGRIFFNYTDLMVTAAKRRRSRSRQVFLTRAEACARRAVEAHQEHGHTQELAFAQRQLARMLAYKAAKTLLPARLREARDLLFQSLQVLTPQDYPADCIATADEATQVCQDLDDWQGASVASAMALAAWRASNGDTVGREDLPLSPEERDPARAELEHDARFRFTAYRLFRAAQQRMTHGAALTDPEVAALLEQAVDVMETGRATTLRAASGADVYELHRLRSLDPALAEAYLSAITTARITPHTPAPAPPHPVGEMNGPPTNHEQQPNALAVSAGPSLDDLLTTIRGLPGLTDFAQGQPPSVADLRAALKPGQALIYLIAHPVGCCALAVTSQDAPAAVVPIDLPATNSAELLALILGIGIRTDGGPGRTRPGQALLAGTQNFHPLRFQRALKEVLAKIGRTMAQPLANELADSHITTAVLVPCGLLPAFAWHAATWREQGTTVSLADALDTLSYTPSAGAWLAARTRAARHAGRPPYLVGLANPSRSQPPLLGAEVELHHIAACFPEQHRAVAYGSEATGTFLLRQLSRATHLHLGCHGSMQYDSIDGAFLMLADDEQFGIARVRRLVGDDLRLVVIAACVSGAVNVLLQPEESHALTIGFMHAGAAGVLGALWPIPDLATALFMSYFYEQLTTEEGIEPAVALARTQHWMRTLTSAAVRQYVAQRPALAALHGRVRLRGSAPVAAGRWTNLARMRSLPRRRPFSAPQYWAAFTLNGC